MIPSRSLPDIRGITMSNVVDIHSIRKGNELRDWLEMAPKGYRQRLADLSGVSNNYLTHIAHGYRSKIGRASCRERV